MNTGFETIAALVVFLAHGSGMQVLRNYLGGPDLRRATDVAETVLRKATPIPAASNKARKGLNTQLLVLLVLHVVSWVPGSLLIALLLMSSEFGFDTEGLSLIETCVLWMWLVLQLMAYGLTCVIPTIRVFSLRRRL
jgi:hypothetical protein